MAYSLVICIVYFRKVSFFWQFGKRENEKEKYETQVVTLFVGCSTKKEISLEREQRHWVLKFELFPSHKSPMCISVIVYRRNLHSFWEQKQKILHWLKITPGKILFSSINNGTWAKKCYKFPSFAIFSFFSQPDIFVVFVNV